MSEQAAKPNKKEKTQAPGKGEVILLTVKRTTSIHSD